MNKKFLFAVFCLVLMSISFLSWSAGELYELDDQAQKSKIEELQQKIKKTSLLLESFKGQKTSILKSISVLESQISYRNELIEEISLVYTKSAEELTLLQSVHKDKLERLNSLKKQYWEILRAKWLDKLSYHPVLTLLQTDKLDERLRSRYFLDYLEKNRKQKLVELEIELKDYFDREKKVKNYLDEQERLKKTHEIEKSNISEDLISQSSTIQNLKSKENELQKELTQYKNEREKLNILILNTISEISKTTTNAKSERSASVWKFPLAGGVIVSRFGKSKDSKESRLILRNNGIDIESEESFVAAATAAEVVQIQKLPNNSYFVLTRIGDLYNVYSNLRNVLVKPGEWVDHGTNIGQCEKNERGSHELHFEVWKGKRAVNPTAYFK
ncbi:MAG: peptidoglycan DD-metalloendopeptidase family protein [Bacteroidota bacterium]|nr:peptidoglycan DD-metalloendopeptidase family protein [Bacteroidota bacterium]